MKKTTFIVLILLSALISKASYRYMTLSNLLAISKNCVIGEIVGLDINYFHLKVESVVFGEAENDTLKILKYSDWNCGRRYDSYQIGQREIVCFKRSNYIIEEYELLLYGAGCESEMPIISDSIVKYQYRYNQFHEYDLKSFIKTIKEFKALLKEKNEQTIKEFENRSPLHRNLAKYFENTNSDDDYFERIKKENAKGSISNIDNQYLYENYPNKLDIIIDGENFENLILEVKNAEITKSKKHFIVKPINGSSSRWIYVKSIKKNDTTIVYKDIFDVYPIPQPKLFFNHSKNDSIQIKFARRLIPRVKHSSNHRYLNKVLEYKVLKFDVDFIKNNSINTIHCKFARGNYSLREAFEKMNINDKVRFYNIHVLYPDGKVYEMKEKTIVLKE